MNRRIRSIVFWLHLLAGLSAGAVVFVMAATGTLLMYERQITEWADRGYRAEPPSPGTARLPVETLLAKAAETVPDVPPSGLTLQADPAAPAVVGLGRGRNLYLNPYTGEGLGEGSPRVRAFFRKVTDWHRWLGAKDEERETARAITGACNLGFLFLVLSGIYLWLPRIWTRAQVRNVAWFRRGLPGKARDFNWHNVIGLWMWVPLVLIVFSGVVLSYPWAGNLVYRMVGEKPPERSGPGGPGREAGRSFEGLDELWAAAERQAPGWESISLRLSGARDEPAAFTILRGQRGRPDLRAQLALDRRSGEVVRWEPYSSQSRGRKLRTWLRWVHTGEAGGLAGQTLAGVASGGAAVLVWTGWALAWRRFFPRRTSKSF